MAVLNGSYKNSNIATIAAMITLFDAYLTAENARMVAMGGAATNIRGTIIITVRANNAMGVTFAHRAIVNFDCNSLASSANITAALSTFATALEANSLYTTVIEVDGSMKTVMTN